MAFNEDKFLSAKYTDRTESIPVPGLKKYFEEDEEPVWVVKALTAEEIARANDEVAKLTNVSAIIMALTSAAANAKAQAVKELVGLSEEHPPADVVKRIAHLVYGSVSPTCQRDTAIRLGENHAVVFFALTNKIMELSGKGRLGE